MSDRVAMGKAARRKGNAWENEVTKAFQANGFRAASRLASPGEKRDIGDIGGIPGFTIECKNHKEYKFGLWIDQLKHAMARSATRWGAVVVKRRMVGVRGAMVVMEFDLFVDLIRQAHESRPGMIDRSRREFVDAEP
jgi:Holliday junction resolvase